jgi:hypothetical protein
MGWCNSWRAVAKCRRTPDDELEDEAGPQWGPMIPVRVHALSPAVTASAETHPTTLDQLENVMATWLVRRHGEMQK